MSMHRLTSGAGYRYLIRHTASGDCDRSGAAALTAYYTQSGNPAGRWFGAGLAGLAGGAGIGAGSIVTEQAMAHLFGAGHDPVTGTPLGRAYPVFVPAPERIKAAIAKLPPMMSAADRVTAIETITQVELAKPARAAVAGFDLTFTVPKSASILWALGEDDVRQVVVDAHRAAMTDALAGLEDTALFTRTGVDGCAQVRTRGMVAVSFDHWDTRTGDPNLHTHVVLANKVQGADGGWRSVDSRALHHAAVSVSEVYDNLFADELARRLPVVWGWRDRGPKRTPGFELDGVSEELLTAFSTRAAQVDAGMIAAIADFFAAHGRTPNRVDMIRLRQTVTTATRPDKQIHALADLIDTWRHRAQQTTGATPGELLAPVLHDAPTPTWASTDVPDDVIDDLATRTLEQVIVRRSTWTAANVLAEAARQTRGLRMVSVADRRDLHERLVTATLARCVPLAAPELFTVPASYRRPDGTSVFTRAGEARFTDTRVLDAEARLLSATDDTTAPAARDDDVQFVVTAPVARTRHRGPVTLAPDQVAAARAIATSGRRLDVLVGPAGTGKTTTLLALRHAWQRTCGTRSVIGLAPSATAAAELADALGIECENTAKWLHESIGPGARQRRARLAELSAAAEHADPVRDRAHLHALTTAVRALQGEDTRWALRPGQLLIVDEASLAGTFTLDTLAAQATASGAKVLVVGDHAQLSAVDAGGAFHLLAERGQPAVLTSLWRFTHRWEAAATRQLRAGNPRVLDTYDEAGRIHAGPGEVMVEAAYTAWRDAGMQGSTAILLAADQRTVDVLNSRAHTDRVTDGTVAPTGITTSTGAPIGAGDRVLTRQNARRLRTSGGRYVRNGDLWDVVATHSDGALTVRRTHRAAASEPARPAHPADTLRLAPAYVAEQVDLGYATTTHRAQGITVDAAHVLAAPGMTRENLYVAMTRGRAENHAYVAIDGVDATCDRLPDPAGDSPGRDILARILATEGAELSATQTLARALDDAESLHHLEPIRQTLTTDAATRRWHTLLPACHLDPDQITAIWTSSERPNLIAALRRGEARGLPMQRILTQVVTDHARRAAAFNHDDHAGGDAETVDLAAALTHDLTAFLDAGAERPDIHGHSRPAALEPIDPSDVATPVIAELTGLLTHRVQALTDWAVATRPAWLRPLDGEPDPGVEHDDWAAHLAAAVTHADLNKLIPPGFTARANALHRTPAPAPRTDTDRNIDR
jgi:conjugative relaxase-like TrwC/TraI family protein